MANTNAKIPRFCHSVNEPLQKLPKNVGDLGKLNFTKAFKKLPKVH